MKFSPVRVVLPAHLRILANIQANSRGEVGLQVKHPITQRTVIDALELRYPTLSGTIRDHQTHRRRAFLRFFACAEDLSHEPLDALLPKAVAEGKEPYLIIASVAGG